MSGVWSFRLAFMALALVSIAANSPVAALVLIAIVIARAAGL